MVRLTTRSYLHLTPEMVGEDFEYPFFAKVVRSDRDEVFFQSLEGGSGSLPRDVALGQVVSSSEVEQAGQLSLLRRSVVAASKGQVRFGQVKETKGDVISIDSAGLLFDAAIHEVSPVAPIVALCLQQVVFDSDEWSDDELEAIQSTIMDRILGRNGAVASNDIATIFTDLFSSECHPLASSECRWIDPQTGAAVEFPLQHAIDFVYYVDGGKQSVPQTVGRNFYSPPAHQVTESNDEESQDVEAAEELFDPFTDDDESSPDQSEDDRFEVRKEDEVNVTSNRLQTDKRRREAAEPMVHEGGPTKTRRLAPQSALDKDVMILQKLGGDPELLERFLEMRRANTDGRADRESVTSGSTLGVAPTQAPATPAKSLKSSTKYDFVPQPEQLYVHDRITSDKHKGKKPSAYCRGMVRSVAVKFKALPGVCTRSFDIRFGSKGLSIRHFARLSQDERIQWLQSGGSNFDNLSASAEFVKAQPATSIADIADDIRVFLSYAREFCCGELVELAEAVLSFTEETLSRVQWSLTELPSVVFWVNDVFEDFRDAVESNGDLSQVKLRCSTDDRLLRDLMFVKVHRRVEELKQSNTVVEFRAGGARVQPGPIQQAETRFSKQSFGRMPKHVLNRLPKQVDPASGETRQLCMRFLSNAGCTEDESGCPSDRGHFVPKKLPEVVKAEIVKRFGGLKAAYKHI